MLIIENIENIENIQKIELQDLPNQSFSVYVEDAIFELQIRTYDSERSTLTIFKDNEILASEVPFIPNLNLLYFTDSEISFFFLATQFLESYNYSNLAKEINLYLAKVTQKKESLEFSFKDIEPIINDELNYESISIKKLNRMFAFETANKEYNAQIVGNFFNTNFYFLAESDN